MTELLFFDYKIYDSLRYEGQELRAFYFKWSETKKSKVPAAFAKAYPDATFEVINRSNYLDFIT